MLFISGLFGAVQTQPEKENRAARHKPGGPVSPNRTACATGEMVSTGPVMPLWASSPALNGAAFSVSHSWRYTSMTSSPTQETFRQMSSLGVWSHHPQGVPIQTLSYPMNAVGPTHYSCSRRGDTR